VSQARKIVKAVEYFWRHTIVYPGLRRILRNPEWKGRVDIRSIRSILILRHDRIGDMIVTTPIFRNLKKANPKLTIGVFASTKNVEIIRHNPYIDVIYVAHSHWLKLAREVMRARRQKYDVVLDFVFNRMTSSGLLANLIAPDGIKIGQGVEKYKFYFNKLLSLKRYRLHMIELLSSFVHNVFKYAGRKKDLDFEIVVDERSKNRVDRFLRNHRLTRRARRGKNESPYVVFNLSGSDELRRLSKDQAYALGDYLGSRHSFRTVVMTAPADNEMERASKRLCREKNCIRFSAEGCTPLLQIASLIGGALGVITPDTAIVHFASAMKTPVIGLYAQSSQNNEWLPFHLKHRIIYSRIHQPANTIPASVLAKSISDFLEEIQS
jgi:ADP-heptose:LPS heptosyltransferase